MSVIVLKLPEPPAGRTWCQVCTMFYRTAIHEHIQERLSALDTDGLNAVAVVRPLAGGLIPDEVTLPPLEITVTRGLYGPLGNLGMLDLCWTHLTPVKILSSGLAPAAAGSEAAVAQALQAQGAQVIGGARRNA